MVRLASVLHRGQVKLVADFNDDYYCDLSSIATNVRDYFHLLYSPRDDDDDNDDTEVTSTVTRVSDRVKSLIETCQQQPQQQTQAEGGTSSSSSSATTSLWPQLYIPAKDCQLLPPLDGNSCRKFLCIGMNYVDHCTEQGVPIPTEPVVFGKYPSTCIVGPGTPIVWDANVTTKLDYEVELGIVIGRTVPRNTTSENAKQYIGGYTIVHDVSARDLQLEKNGGQWLIGKSIDGYAPIGPVVVTTTTGDDSNDNDNELSWTTTFDKIHSAGIRCRVNGETLQDSNTDQLVFKANDIIAYISRFMTLEVGDIIATGTPPGVGCFRHPPRWLQPGDIVECEIDGIGTLTNQVKDASGTPAVATTKPSTVMSVPSTSSYFGRLGGMACIVTGAAQGIGYGIAYKLGCEGATRVAVVDLSSKTTQDACEQLHHKCPSCDYVPLPCDVSDESAVQKAWGQFSDMNGGRIDVLVQAAGVVGKTNVLIENVDCDNFDDVFRVNVRGIFNGCKAVLPIMKQNGYGRIVNIASIAGKEGNAGMLAYSASKSAVIGLTKTIGKEYATAGITCNALAPAVVRTQMVEDMPDEQVKYMTDKIPMKRCGSIEEIASMVCFIASPECSFTTGFCFDATGGRSVY